MFEIMIIMCYNGFNNNINTPPAKLERLPCKANPTATPAEPIAATTDVVATPNKLRIVIIKIKYNPYFTIALKN